MDRRIPMLRVVTLALLAVVLAITTLSAYIRLARAGVGCEPWPACQAQARREAPTSGPVAAARIAHRVVATVALLLVVALLMATLATQPALRTPGRLVLVLLGLALFLAVLGRMTADSRAPAVVLANLLAGFAMLAVAGRLFLGLWRDGGGEPTAIPAARGWSTLVLLVATIALGAASSAADAVAPFPGRLSLLVHEWGGAALLAAMLPLAATVRRRDPPLGAVLIALVLLQAGASSLLAARISPLAATLAHNALAALLLACVAQIVGARSGRALPHSNSL